MVQRRTNQPDAWAEERPADRSDDLDEIDAHIARLFELVADGLGAATVAFLSGDRVAAQKVASADVVIDDLHAGTEELVQRQLRSAAGGIEPAGLARLVLALRIMPELERSGDLVEHIAARASAVLLGQLTDEVRLMIREMSELAVALWRRAADSFTGGDTPSMDELRLLDDELDDLHVQLSSSLTETDLSIAAAIEMGLVGRFYERLGDHAVNVARRVEMEDALVGAAHGEG